jgi:hypothetical protein
LDNSVKNMRVLFNDERRAKAVISGSRRRCHRMHGMRYLDFSKFDETTAMQTVC